MNPVTLIKKRAQKLSPTSRKGLKGVGWVGVNQAFSMVLRLGSTLILTRLLAPEAFGLLGTAQVILDTLYFFCDIGLMAALVRHPKGNEPAVLLTGWWINLARLAGLTLFMMALAVPLARFYRQPELVPVLLLVALRPILTGLRSPGAPLLQREMRFREFYLLEMSFQLVSVVASVLLALAYRSVMSIVIGTLIGVVASIAVSYVFAPMRPRWMWNRGAAREIGHFGGKVFFNTMAMALWLNIDRMLGLRMLSPAVMGYYSIAWSLSSMLDILCQRGCNDVYYTMILKKPEHERLAWHDRMSKRVAFGLMPLLIPAIALAPLVIEILYDNRYRPASVLLAVLMARTMVRVLSTFEFQYLVTLAAIPLQTFSYLAAALVQAAIFIPMVRAWGALGMACSCLISAIVLAIVQAVLMRWRTGRGGFISLGISLVWMAAGLVLYKIFWR